MAYSYAHKIIDDPGALLHGWTSIGIGERPLEEQVAWLETRGLDRIQLDFDTLYGWSPRDLSLLRRFPRAQAVRIGGNFADPAPLAALEAPRAFTDRAAHRKGFDFSGLYGLERLWVDYEAAHPKYERFTQLRELGVARLPKRFNAFAAFGGTSLECVSIRSSPIETLAGAEAHPNLRDVLIHRCRRFNPGALPAALPGLRRLRLQYCPALADLSFLDAMPNLEELEIYKCGPGHDVAATAHLKRLKRVLIA